MSMGAQSGILIDRSASGCPVMKSEDKESFHLNESQPSTLTSVSTMNAVQYNWGKECKAWFLLKNPKLTVIQEEMPPGSSGVEETHAKTPAAPAIRNSRKDAKAPRNTRYQASDPPRSLLCRLYRGSGSPNLVVVWIHLLPLVFASWRLCVRS